MTDHVRILIADDHDLVRETLGRYLSQVAGFDLVASVDCGEDAVAAAREHEPDVVLMDVDMPGLSSFDAAQRIKSFCPTIHLIFVSAFASDSYVEQALETGAIAYLTKGESPESVVEAIHKAVANRPSFSEEVRRRLIFDEGGVRLGQKVTSRRSMLSDREMEVLRYLAQGLTKKAIAEQMCISVKTVERHAYNLMNKLDIHDRVELALFAVREGIIEV